MFSRIYIEDIDVVKMFIGECKDSLVSFERNILKLEVDAENNELLDDIFKIVHRLKCESSFLGLSCITRLCREIELILQAIRERNIVVDKELIDNILLFADFIRDYVAKLQETITEKNHENGLYLEIDTEQNKKQEYESLIQTYDSYKHIEKINSQQESDTTEWDSLPDEFKKDFSAGIKEQFILESTEQIEIIENDLLIRLDANNDDKEAVNDIFRAVHTIKGGTGIYLSALPPQSPEHTSLKKFSEVVHTFESLLALIRDKGYKYENKYIDLSFSVIDFLKSFLCSVNSNDYSNLHDDIILETLNEHILQLQSAKDCTVSDTIAPVHRESIKTDKTDKTDEAKAKSNMIQSIRVNQDKIDNMMNMISELFIAKNSFTHISKKLMLEYNLPEISKEVIQFGEHLNRISDELQTAIMSIRMVEIKTVFQRLPRVVRDIAQSSGKKMELHMEGENTELDKKIIEQISDPLIHLIRNSADHGIETPEERRSKGKSEVGTIVLRAYNNNKYVFIEIEDDGKGIDVEGIKKKAIEKGFISSAEAERMSYNQLLNLIFLPGFSTAKQITEISGRGVGMDIVKSNIAKIYGNIKIESTVDKGTKMIIQLPLSMAVTRDLISRGLIVEAAGEIYIIPLKYIIGSIKINKNSIHEFDGKCFTYLRGDVTRVEWLCKIFHTGDRNTEKEELNAVVLSNGAENFAIVVDKLKNEQEFVVKTLDGQLAAIPGISGSTLLGDGKVVLIVNPVDILQLAEK